MHCDTLASVQLCTCNPCGPPRHATDKALLWWNRTLSIGVWTKACHCRQPGSIIPHLCSLFVFPLSLSLLHVYITLLLWSLSIPAENQCRLMPELYVVWIWTAWSPAEMNRDLIQLSWQLNGSFPSVVTGSDFHSKHLDTFDNVTNGSLCLEAISSVSSSLQLFVQWASKWN